MADKKISELTVATPAGADYVPLLDVSDTSMGPGGSTRKALVSALPFDPAGTAGAEVAGHEDASDPHGDRAYTDDAIYNLQLGNASTRNVPASGDAGALEVVIGSDSRLSNPRTPTAHSHVLTDLDGMTLFGRNWAQLTGAGDGRAALGLGTVVTLSSDTDGTLAANSDTRVATQKAVKTYVDTAVTGLLDFKGNLSATANPNYPAALKGDAYYVSAAGRVGGGSGKSVDVGDVVIASADNAGGTEASVGTSWFVIEHNLVGAVLASNNLSDLANAATARTNLGLAIGTDVQAYDADLAAIAVLAGTNTIYYRSAANTWTAVTIGGLLSFTGGTLNVGDAELVAIAGLASAADKMPYFTGAGTAALADFTAAGRALVDDADAAAQRATIGLALIARGAFFASVADGTVTLEAKAAFAFSISQVRGLKTSSGSCTLAVQINGTNVTSLSGLSVTTSAQDVTATGANAVAVGDRVTIVISSSSSPAGLEFTLSATR